MVNRKKGFEIMADAETYEYGFTTDEEGNIKPLNKSDWKVVFPWLNEKEADTEESSDE